MDGAVHLRRNWLKSEILINTDTEEIGEIYIGCAGGVNANVELSIHHETNSFNHTLQINLKGLRGGHSGCDIHTTRANAIKVLATLIGKNFHKINRTLLLQKFVVAQFVMRFHVKPLQPFASIMM